MIVKRIPAPQDTAKKPLRALIFDSHYDSYKVHAQPIIRKYLSALFVQVANYLDGTLMRTVVLLPIVCFVGKCFWNFKKAPLNVLSEPTLHVTLQVYSLVRSIMHCMSLVAAQYDLR